MEGLAKLVLYLLTELVVAGAHLNFLSVCRAQEEDGSDLFGSVFAGIF